MKKKFCLIIALCMAMSVCLGLGFTLTKANAAETNTVSGLFRMKDGASVRVGEPYGIRFTTEVGADYTASLESVHSGKTFKFGTQLKITVDGVTKGMNIEAEKFVDTTEGRLYNTVVTDIPEEFFNTFVTAASYVKVYDGETLVTTYYADNNGQTRSAAQVASRALADGKTDAVLSEYVKNAEEFSFGGATGTLMLGKSDLNDYLTVNPSKITPVYRSGDETVATVDKYGIITAKKTGEQVLITATLGTKSASCTFTVGNEGVIYQNEEKLGYCGWPTVAKIYDDKLISVWSLRQTHQDPYGKVVGAISEDNGVTWGEPFTIIDTVLDDRDAGVIFWNNKVIVSTVSVSKHIYLNSGNQEWIDYTNAITDEQEAEALGCKYVIGEMVNGKLTFGEIKKAPAFTPHGMIKLANGDLGYVGYDGYDRETGITKTKITFYSSADGETWSKVSEVFGANEFLVDKLNEPNAIVLKNGKMIVAVRSESGGIYIAESDDGGVTFSNKRALLPAAISTPPHLMQMTDGTLVLSYGYRSEPFNIRAIVSKDNGESWSNEIELTSGGVDWDFGYPATIERGNGELLTVYYQKLSADKKNTSLKEVIWTIPENLTYGEKVVASYDITSAAFVLRTDAQATTLTVGEEGGENVITYSSTAGVWDARAQFSVKMLDLVTANRQLGGKALSLDFKYEGDVSTLQLWCITSEGMEGVTVADLVNNGTATIAYNGYGIGWESVSKGVWYTLYVDLDKFATAYGDIVYSNSGNSNNCGLQAATISTLKVKGIKFISATDMPALIEAREAFQKFQNCTVTTDAATGITTYTAGAGNEYDSRAQFTTVMLNKCVEYYALTEDYSVSMEFRYTGDVKNMQFWVYKPWPATLTPTLESLVNEGIAIIKKGENQYRFDQLVKGEWYTVYVDIHRFGEIIKSGTNNIGVQVASLSTIEYKMAKFVPSPQMPLIPFVKVESGVTLTTELNNGNVTINYVGAGSDWGSRIQLTTTFYAEYAKNYKAGNKIMAFDFKYEETVRDMQFWKINEAGNYGATPTLSGLVGNEVTLYKADGTACAYNDMEAGEWYTAKFDIASFGALGEKTGEGAKCGFMMGCANTAIQFKNFKFEDKN